MKGETNFIIIDRWYCHVLDSTTKYKIHDIDKYDRLMPKLKKSFKVIPNYTIKPVGVCGRTDYMFNAIEIPARLKYCFDSVKPMESIWNNVILNTNAVNLFKTYSGTIYIGHSNYFNGINSYYFIDESRIARGRKSNRFDEMIGL